MGVEFWLSMNEVAFRTTFFFVAVVFLLFAVPWAIGKVWVPLERRWVSYLVGVVLGLVVFFCFVRVPNRCVVSPESVRVEAIWGGYDIPREDIENVYVEFAGKIFRNGRRTGGIGGLVGYSGTYATEMFPQGVRVDSRRLTGNLVVIRRKSGRVHVVGPDDEERFVEAVTK